MEARPPKGDPALGAALRAAGESDGAAARGHRLVDAYDEAQERGEVAKRGGERSGREHSPTAPAASDLGLTRKFIHEAREIRDAGPRAT